MTLKEEYTVSDEKRLNDEAVEDVAGGFDWDQDKADFKAFVELNCTDCNRAKGGGCYYPGISGAGQRLVFYDFGRKPDAVCTHKY